MESTARRASIWPQKSRECAPTSERKSRGSVGATLVAAQGPPGNPNKAWSAFPCPVVVAQSTPPLAPPYQGGNQPVATFRYPLLVTSRTGYQNLCRLITRMKITRPKNSPPEVYAAAREDLRPYTEGMICLTGGDEGPLSAALARDGLAGGEQCLRDLAELFGRDNVYVELQRHYLPREEARNHAAVALARRCNLPLVATGGVCYADGACPRSHGRLHLPPPSP